MINCSSSVFIIIYFTSDSLITTLAVKIIYFQAPVHRVDASLCFLGWGSGQPVVAEEGYNWCPVLGVVWESLQIPLVGEMTGDQLVHQDKERDGVTHRVSPPEHGTIDDIDQNLHEEVGTGRVLEQVPLGEEVSVSDHHSCKKRGTSVITMTIAPERRY